MSENRTLDNASLIRMAFEAMQNAYVPYSGSKAIVNARIDKDGRISPRAIRCSSD